MWVSIARRPPFKSFFGFRSLAVGAGFFVVGFFALIRMWDTRLQFAPVMHAHTGAHAARAQVILDLLTPQGEKSPAHVFRAVVAGAFRSSLADALPPIQRFRCSIQARTFSSSTVSGTAPSCSSTS